MFFLDLLGLLVVLLALSLPVAVIFLLFRVAGLKRRIEAMEHTLSRVPAPQSAAQSAPIAAAAPPPRTAAEEAADSAAKAIPEAAALSTPQPSPQSTPEPAPLAASGPAAPEPAAPESAAPEPKAPEREAPEPEAARLPQVARRPRPAASAEPDFAARLAGWLRVNWVYAISALSLALAGIFFVQYGIENGLLPPAARVAAALGFGLVLIAAGEWLRRKALSRPDAAIAHLPATFAGAGLVSVFGAVIAARQLYGLIGAETAFAGLVATAILAIGLGWFHGAFLAAVGLVGAAAAPFLVGGSSENAQWLYGYFALIAGIGLATDTMRRWAWVSVLALALGYGGGALTYAGTGGAGAFALLLGALPLLAILVPARGLMPDQGGAMVAEALARHGKGARPLFPTRLAAGTVLLSTALLVMNRGESAADAGLVFLCLALLSAALIVWSAGARALSDLAAIPAAGFLLRLALEGADRAPLAAAYAERAIALRPPETAAPMTVAVLLALAALLTLLAAWRSGQGKEYRPAWAAGAALIAPMAAAGLELYWTPGAVLGAYPWALHVIALAALMAALATRFAAADGADRRRAAYAVLATLSLVALALFLVLTKGALTLALAVLVIVAAALDRRFDLRDMGWFIEAGIVTLSYRLVADPGLDWAVDVASLGEAIAAYGGAAAAMAAALWLIRGRERRGPRVFLESAFFAYAALFANVLITRWLVRLPDNIFPDHWEYTLNALPWLIVMLTQLWRMQLGGALRWLRYAIAAGAGLLALGGLALAVTFGNPLFTSFGPVAGPPMIDTLAVAYALPGLMLVYAALRLGHLPRALRLLLAAPGLFLLALYGGLEIRRFWRGDDLSVPGVTQPELYSYTLALLMVGAGLLYQAIARGAPGMRRAAMVVIGLTIAKVFLIDASGLSGLTRVFSFLALGLALAALAWLNRWAAKASEP